MKRLTITCKSTDEDDEFTTELQLIMKMLQLGRDSGFDSNNTNAFKFNVAYE